MLIKLTIQRFKVLDDVEIELGNRVLFVGPNNSGKTSALQALALWDIGVKRWVEKRGSGSVPEKRPGITINRRDLIAVPVPEAKLLWRNLRTQQPKRGGGTEKVYLTVIVEGLESGVVWRSGMEFYYANEESFYCRSLLDAGGNRMMVPQAAVDVRLAYLPPMSGLAAIETRLDVGAISVRMGEGRTAEVLRNICWQVLEGNDGEAKWAEIVQRMKELFGIRLQQPRHVPERGEITLSYKTHDDISLDISSSGRGQQQTLLLLAHMSAHPGSVLLLDEPDAHLEILRQRQIYHILTTAAIETRSQILAASHSEVMLNEAADQDIVIAFVGRPHRIDDRGSQVLKSLKEIGFDQYFQAEETGWVLYLEGSTDLAMMRAFAKRLDHPAKEALERPFVHYVGNLQSKARAHFHGLRESKDNLIGCAIYDRLPEITEVDPYLQQHMWRMREFENYVCQKETLLSYAEEEGRIHAGDLFSIEWREAMDTAIIEIEMALKSLGKASPWDPNTKASDDFLDPLFKKFFESLKLPNLMRKTDYHTLVPFVPHDAIDPEISEKLDAILVVKKKAKPRLN